MAVQRHRWIRRVFSITAASGTTYSWWPAEDDGDATRNQVSGRIIAVKARLHDFGGWTFNALRVRIGDPVRGTGNIDPSIIAANASDRLLYDSGAIATFTGLFLDDNLGELQVPYGPTLLHPTLLPGDGNGAWTVGIEYGTSAGSGTSTITVRVAILEDVL